MKKLISLVICLHMIFTFFIPVFASDNEIHIKNENDWILLSDGSQHNKDYQGTTIILDNDIDLGQNPFYIRATMLGSETCPFRGKFKGNGHTIKVAIQNNYIPFLGLFAYCDNAWIENFVLDGFISGSDNPYGNRVLNNSYSTNYMNVYACGGICGHANGNTYIANCINKAEISGVENVGGICGLAEDRTIIQHCVNDGAVSGENYVGGICGAFLGDVVSNCINNAEVSGQSAVGGVLGNMLRGKIVLCVNNAMSGSGFCGKLDENLTNILTNINIDNYMLTENGFKLTSNFITADENEEYYTIENFVELLNEKEQPGIQVHWIAVNNRITFEMDYNNFNSASVLSDGSIWIIAAVAVVAVAGVATLVIVKKKKKTAHDEIHNS